MSPLRVRQLVGLLGIVIAFACFGQTAGTANADDPTPTATPTATVTPSPLPTDTPVPPTVTPLPTATATPIPRPRVLPTRESKRHRTHGKTNRPAGHRSTAAASPTATPTLTPRPESRHHRTKRKPKPTPTPTPTPTRVPALSLSTEDSVKPVTCNRAPAGPAPAPFLLPPYHGWTSIVSYFDHDLPDFVQDGLVITASGLQAAPDAVHQRTDFPAYWNAGIRQYVYYDGHNGYDYNVSYVPLYAAAAGKVIFARMEYPDAPTHGYGNMVMIEHPHGYVTLYGHLSKIQVHAGEKVRAGQQIGISGNTGHSTGPHVHFTVFHNCTPTDPYGWSGPGPDPLSGYQGETSEYLWKQEPLVVNPLPGWPGSAALPAPPTERLLLLRLPSPSGGTDAFLSALHQEADKAAQTLRASGAQVQEDLIRGLLEVDGPVTAAAIYHVADVASISSPDTIEGAKDDVLAALARAALVHPQKSIVLSRTHHWKGFLLRWQGSTFLVGRGNKGDRVNLRLSSGRGGSWHHIAADPKTGAYAIDLGPMSSQAFHRLQSNLQHPSGSGGANVQPVGRSRSVAAIDSPSRSSSPIFWILLAVAVAVFLAAAASSHVLTLRHRNGGGEPE